MKTVVTKVLKPFLRPIADIQCIESVHLHCLGHILEVRSFALPLSCLHPYYPPRPYLTVRPLS
jgi:hypothetical protein